MWHDLWQYLQALRRHFVGLATGTVMALVLLVWDDVLHWGDIPAGVWVVAAVTGFFVSGFNAWREEHAKVAPTEPVDLELELRRPEFERAIAKLAPKQEAVLHYVVRVGDSDAPQLRQFLNEQGESGSTDDADMLLTIIAEAGLLEVKEKGNAYGRYRIKPVWQKLLVEWAAPPTVVDKRIADKARALRRTLAASFEDWPTGLNKLDDLTTWAAKLLRGFGRTEPALKEIVELRSEASRRIERTVGAASDAYYSGRHHQQTVQGRRVVYRRRQPADRRDAAPGGRGARQGVPYRVGSTHEHLVEDMQ